MMREHISLKFLIFMYVFYTCNTQNIRRMASKIGIIEAKQELESKIRKAAIEAVDEKIDDLEEKVSKMTGPDTDNDSFERKNGKSDRSSVQLLSEEVKSLKGDYSRLARAFNAEKKQNIKNKLKITELNERVSREFDKNEMADAVNSMVKKEIAKLEQELYLNITEQLKEGLLVTAEIKEESNGENTETMVNRKVADDQHGSCLELLENGGKTESGVYTIYPLGGENTGIRVYCDQTTDGGGWTVFQRRTDYSMDFYRNWEEYKVGFGRLDGEFWLGNDYLSLLTSSGNKELRVNIEEQKTAERVYAKYSGFRIGLEIENYSLHFSQFLEGTCGDALSYHNGMPFSTADRDNERDSRNCAERFKAGWWFNGCFEANLNGAYNKRSSYGDLFWYDSKRFKMYWFKSTEMMIR